MGKVKGDESRTSSGQYSLSFSAIKEKDKFDHKYSQMISQTIRLVNKIITPEMV